MKIHHVTQGSDEWHALRLGLPTASCFDRIMTRTGKPSSQAEKYKHQLLAEWAMGHPDDLFESQWMARGKYLEDEAVAYYEMDTDTTTDPGGFVTAHGDTVGCSPDRLVYATGQHERPIGGLEIKCGKGATHVGYLLGGDAFNGQYEHQVQGCMWVCGLDWWDTLTYHPDFGEAAGHVVRVERDPKWAENFAPLLHAFVDDLEAGKKQLRKLGIHSPLEVAA